MSDFSDFAEIAIVRHLMRDEALSLPASWHFALFTAGPNEDGTGTEVSTGVWTNYARPAVIRNTTNFTDPADDAAEGHESENVGDIDFGTAAITGTAPVVVGIGVADAATAGNIWMLKALASPKTINNGDPVKFTAGDFAFGLR